MKKITAILLAFSLLFAMAGCTKGKEQKNSDPTDIMKKITSEVEFPEMAEQNKESLTGYIDLNTDDIEAMAYQIAGSGATADEVFVVKMKAETDMEAVKEKLNIRLKTQKDLFTTYNPDEIEKLETAVVEVKGNYAILAITNDNDKVKKIFNDSI